MSASTAFGYSTTVSAYEVLGLMGSKWTLVKTQGDWWLVAPRRNPFAKRITLMVDCRDLQRVRDMPRIVRFHKMHAELIQHERGAA